MTITLSTAARNTAGDALADSVDAGTTDTTGDLVLMAAGDVVVATLAMSNPAFGASAAGVVTANAITDDVNAVGGTVVAFKIQDRDNAEILRGSVTDTSGNGDMKMSPVLVGASDTVSVSSLTITMPASSATPVLANPAILAPTPTRTRPLPL